MSAFRDRNWQRRVESSHASDVLFRASSASVVNNAYLGLIRKARLQWFDQIGGKDLKNLKGTASLKLRGNKAPGVQERDAIQPAR